MTPTTGTYQGGRFTPCHTCGGSPAIHNPHPLNESYPGHEYTAACRHSHCILPAHPRTQDHQDRRGNRWEPAR